MARRSTFENANILILFHKRNLITDESLEKLLDKLDHLCRKITNFQGSLKQRYALCALRYAVGLEVVMLIRSCLICKHHEFKLVDNERMSYCQKENCYSRYSKCVANKALNKFLEQESREPDRSYSTIPQLK